MSDSTAEAARREAARAIVQRFEMYHSRVGSAIIPHEGDGNQYPLKAVLAMLEEMALWEARNTQVTVTDDMVEAALDAWFAEWERRAVVESADKPAMRAAIVAALEKREI